MADNITLSPSGGGSVVATDEIGGFHFQRVKPTFGVDGVATDVSAANPLPVVTKAIPGTLVSVSGSLTTGGTAQSVSSVNANRIGWSIQNLHATSDLWVSTLAVAVQSQPSIRIPAGALYESPVGGQGTGAISVIGPTTGQTFTGREW